MKQRSLAASLVIVALVAAACGPSRPTGTFTPTGSMITARYGDTATLLQDGRVLVVGGTDSGRGFPASAELYDPKSGKFAATGTMEDGRTGHTVNLLPDGRVLVAGGFGGTAKRQLAEAESLDPKTGIFSPAGSMTTARAGHTATLLQDGRVLIAGGQQGVLDNTGYLASAELYDPKTGSFSATGSMTTQRADHTATLLHDGRVLIAGGTGGAGNYGTVEQDSAELFDPRTGTFTATGSMKKERTGLAAFLLSDGRVVVVGGASDYSAELYDPKSGKFSPAGSLRDSVACASLLADGRVLVINNPAGGFAQGELYDPTNGTLTWSNSFGLGGEWPTTATLLQDGRVLLAGGGRIGSAHAFVYQP